MKKIIFILLAAALLSLAGCKSEPACTSEFAPQSGTYSAEATESSVVSPRLDIDFEKKTFAFSFDALSSYWAHGNFETDAAGYLLKCTTDDGRFFYNFHITSTGSIEFVAEGSSPIDMIQGEPSVVDGTEFKLKQ